jgi:hypothetical protein
MILRTTFIVATAILFLSGPAQGDPLKFKSHGAFSENFHFNNNSNNGHSNIKFLGGFKPQSGKNRASSSSTKTISSWSCLTISIIPTTAPRTRLPLRNLAL